MRFTNKLYAQHLGWHFKKHWQVQGKRVARDTGAAAELEKLGIQIKDPKDILETKLERKCIEVVGFKPVAVPEDETHPNWHNQACYIYGDSNVLLEGLPQAQILTKTIEITGFPKNIENSINKMQLSSTVDRRVQNSIMASHIYDAQQVKLPKIKLAERPAYNLPREYGISHDRRSRLLINKLIFECEKLAGPTTTSRRRLIDNVDFKASFTKNDDYVQLHVSAEKIITSTRPIEAVMSKYDGELPDLYPIKCTITIPKRHVYDSSNFYPISNNMKCSHPHTIFLHFNKEFVGNLYETSVTETQFQSRTLLKAFAVAASRAKQLYGEAAVENLPKPIVVQSIQTDGKTFHFGVLQLNTLAVSNSDGVKNYWFHQPNVDLFTECGYKAGRPTLIGYNKDTFRLLNAFYSSV